MLKKTQVKRQATSRSTILQRLLMEQHILPAAVAESKHVLSQAHIRVKYHVKFSGFDTWRSASARPY
jgi:hypothetical protein